MTMEMQMGSLEEFLAADGAPAGFDEAMTTGFSISNEDEALWAMRRLAQAQRRLDEVDRQAEVERARIARWVEANSEQHGSAVAFFETALSEYLMRVREDEADGRRSLDFPDGKVTSRATQPKVTVEDSEAFLAWAEANGHSEWVRVKREADVATIKKLSLIHI